jgi:bifunctional non-homologous end joining protein LigD
MTPPRPASAHGGQRPDPRAGRLPAQLKPMLATAAAEPFDSRDHIFELKLDGLRAVAFVEAGEVRVQNRRLQDARPQFPQFADVPRRVKARSAVLDGEIVALDSQGRTSLPLLQERLQGKTGPLTYQVFDILYLDGASLIHLPLARRKTILHQTLVPSDFLQACDFVDGEGVAFFEAAAEHGLEGIVAKEKASPYRPGERSRAWQTVKAFCADDFVIGGYAFGGGRRPEPLSTLLLGRYQGERLVHVGDVSGPFPEDAARMLLSLLQPLHSAECPFAEPPRLLRFIYWCRPELACRARFSEWTRDGKLRFPLFVAVRPDVPPRECLLEPPAPPCL